MMQTLYAFSGLGADKRVFSKLDLSAFHIVHVEWIEPRPFESLLSYVHRLAEHYKIPKVGAIVIGVSFGGMCIAELAKSYEFRKSVLLSSAKTKHELPKSYTFSKLFSLHKLIPEKQLTKPNMMLNWLFGVEGPDEKKLLASIISDSNPSFLQWAIDQIIRWDNTEVPVNCLHIHGDKDRIIPINNVDYSIKIRGGGHFMILNRAEELSFSIRNFLL